MIYNYYDDSRFLFFILPFLIFEILMYIAYCIVSSKLEEKSFKKDKQQYQRCLLYLKTSKKKAKEVQVKYMTDDVVEEKKIENCMSAGPIVNSKFYTFISIEEDQRYILLEDISWIEGDIESLKTELSKI